MNIFTIGHSNHTVDEFLLLLKSYKIDLIVDVRAFPGSKHVTQFNRDNMEGWLSENDIKYLHMKELGGRRNKNKEIDYSLVDGWKNASFKNYAAYSLTKDYEEGINKLINLSNENNVCYMCSEAVPWRCHRLIISNTLVLKGLNVFHIMTENKTITHEIGKYGAKVVKSDSKLIYPNVNTSNY